MKLKKIGKPKNKLLQLQILKLQKKRLLDRKKKLSSSLGRSHYKPLKLKSKKENNTDQESLSWLTYQVYCTVTRRIIIDPISVMILHYLIDIGESPRLFTAFLYLCIHTVLKLPNIVHDWHKD